MWLEHIDHEASDPASSVTMIIRPFGMLIGISPWQLRAKEHAKRQDITQYVTEKTEKANTQYVTEKANTQYDDETDAMKHEIVWDAVGEQLLRDAVTEFRAMGGDVAKLVPMPPKVPPPIGDVAKLVPMPPQVPPPRDRGRRGAGHAALRAAQPGVAAAAAETRPTRKTTRGAGQAPRGDGECQKTSIWQKNAAKRQNAGQDTGKSSISSGGRAQLSLAQLSSALKEARRSLGKEQLTFVRNASCHRGTEPREL